MDFHPSDKINERYQIVCEPKSGGYGFVYKAKRIGFDDKYYAIKAFDISKQCFASSAINAAILESSILKFVEDKGFFVPGFHEVFSCNDVLCIVMDWIDGEPFSADSIKKIKFKTDKGESEILSDICIKLLSSVSKMTAMNVFHMDLTPSNIILTMASDGAVVPYLLDFGLSVFSFSENNNLFNITSGTHCYRDPAFASHRNLTYCDYYSVGACMYYMITGHEPVAEFGKNKLLKDFIKQSQNNTFASISSDIAGLIDGLMNESIDVRFRAIFDYISSAPNENAFGCNFKSNLQLIRNEVDNAPVNRNPLPNQKVLLQSFDTVRVENSNFLPKNTRQFSLDPVFKMAMGRSEALISFLMGREIAIPAGHIAESRTFMDLFSEVYPSFNNIMSISDRLCSEYKLEKWRPFRVTLENNNYKSYKDFVRNYRLPDTFTINLTNAIEQQYARNGLEEIKNAFLKKDFPRLETLIHVDGYSDFAKNVYDYFDDTKNIYSRQSYIGVSDYVKTYIDKVSDKRLDGNMVEKARNFIPKLEKIKNDISVEDQNYRGAWYKRAENFEELWPLARAYFDTRLYFDLSIRYGIDHVLFQSQEFEYGVFDHSLILGFGFSPTVNLGDNLPSALTILQDSPAKMVHWDYFFENLFTNSKFFKSLNYLNQMYYFADSKRYHDAAIRHLLLVEDILFSEMEVINSDGRLSVSPKNAHEKDINVATCIIDSGRSAEKMNEDYINGLSFLPQFIETRYMRAAVALQYLNSNKTVCYSIVPYK